MLVIPDCIQQKAKMFQRHYAGNLRVTCLELNFRLSRWGCCACLALGIGFLLLSGPWLQRDILDAVFSVHGFCVDTLQVHPCPINA